MRKQITVEDVRSFTLEQFTRVRETNEIKKLVHFHTINKYLFMAHSQKELKILGKLVANLDKRPIDIIFKEYEEHLKQVLSQDASLQSTTNVLTKIYSHFRKKITSEEKKLFLKLIEDYRSEKIPLGEVLNHVDSLIHKYENGYLQRQTFYLLHSDVIDDFFSGN